MKLLNPRFYPQINDFLYEAKEGMDIPKSAKIKIMDMFSLKMEPKLT